MRTLILLVTSLALATACGDDAVVDSDTTTTSDPADTAVTDSGDTSVATDVEPDSVADSTPDTGHDTGPIDTFNPQEDAWSTTWARTLEGTDPHVVAMRYLSQQSQAAVLAVLELGAGTADLDSGDGASDALPGEGHRVVFVNFDPTQGALREAKAFELAQGEALGETTKGPNGFAVGITGASPRVVLAQIFGTSLRTLTLTISADTGTVGIALPASADLLQTTTGGATTPLAVQLTAASAASLHVIEGETDVVLDVPAGGGIGFVTVAAPTDDMTLPAEGNDLVVVAKLTPERVSETRSGPVLTATVTANTTIGTTALTAGSSALIVGAVPESGPIVPLVLWSSPAAAEADMQVVQVTSGGIGGLVLAGVGEGDLTFGPDTLETEQPRDFIASVGSASALLYTAAECDKILAVTAGNQYRILKTTCDAGGEGPGLVLTSLTTDFGGTLQAPIDFTLTPFYGATPTVLSGLVSFTVTDGRAYGALIDLGSGARLFLVRQDGQPYDSGVLDELTPSGDSHDPIQFQILRQGGFGGGGGGSSATTNAFVFSVPRAGGPRIGRARVDLKTLIQ